MMKTTRLSTLPSLFVLSLLLLVGKTGYAEQKKVFGPYDVHYSVVNSSFLTPKVAEAYGIVRANNRCLINIAVRKQKREGGTEAQAVKISGKSSDLIHTADLNFREIVEQGAIYYIAELEFHHMEVRTFDIKLQPPGEDAPYTLKFSQTLYRDQ